MFTYPEYNGVCYPQMVPYFYDYFTNMIEMIGRLNETRNDKWSD